MDRDQPGRADGRDLEDLGAHLAGASSGPARARPYDSAEMRRELDEVKNYPRTNLTNLTASYWEYYGGRAGYEYWTNQATQKHLRVPAGHEPAGGGARLRAGGHRLLRLVRGLLGRQVRLLGGAPGDARPGDHDGVHHAEPPELPVGARLSSGAAGTVLAALFPRDAAYYEALIAEVSEARIMGGIHVRSDQVAGEALGRQVAGVVLARAGDR